MWTLAFNACEVRKLSAQTHQGYVVPLHVIDIDQLLCDYNQSIPSSPERWEVILNQLKFDSKNAKAPR